MLARTQYRHGQSSWYLLLDRVYGQDVLWREKCPEQFVVVRTSAFSRTDLNIRVSAAPVSLWTLLSKTKCTECGSRREIPNPLARESLSFSEVLGFHFSPLSEHDMSFDHYECWCLSVSQWALPLCSIPYIKSKFRGRFANTWQSFSLILLHSSLSVSSDWTKYVAINTVFYEPSFITNWWTQR